MRKKEKVKLCNNELQKAIIVFTDIEGRVEFGRRSERKDVTHEEIARVYQENKYFAEEGAIRKLLDIFNF